MSDSRFDVEEVFDASDYRYFYDLSLTAERTAREVELIWKILELQPGMEVLDLACGYGRIANALAAHGCHVTGIDISPVYIEQARREADTQALAVDYHVGDMRALPWSERFERIVNWFTAYGYFEDDENRKVLVEAYRALKPGGRLLMELNNRDGILRNFQAAQIVERDGNYLLDQGRYDVFTGRIETERTVLRDGRKRRMHFFVRLFTFPEIATWLRDAGFRKVDGYDQNGEPYSLTARRMIVVAEK